MGTTVPEMHHPRGVTAKKGGLPPGLPVGRLCPDRRRNRGEFREFRSIQGIPGALLMASGDHA